MLGFVRVARQLYVGKQPVFIMRPSPQPMNGLGDGLDLTSLPEFTPVSMQSGMYDADLTTVLDVPSTLPST